MACEPNPHPSSTLGHLRPPPQVQCRHHDVSILDALTVHPHKSRGPGCWVSQSPFRLAGLNGLTCTVSPPPPRQPQMFVHPGKLGHGLFRIASKPPQPRARFASPSLDPCIPLLRPLPSNALLHPPPAVAVHPRHKSRCTPIPRRPLPLGFAHQLRCPLRRLGPPQRRPHPLLVIGGDRHGPLAVECAPLPRTLRPEERQSVLPMARHAPFPSA